jgi:hypothetical protein
MLRIVKLAIAGAITLSVWAYVLSLELSDSTRTFVLLVRIRPPKIAESAPMGGIYDDVCIMCSFLCWQCLRSDLVCL